MLIPAGVDLFHNDRDWETFVLSSFIAIFLGGIMCIPTKDVSGSLSKRDIFILIPLAWVVMPLIATLPIYTSELGLSFTDAYFEAVSGVTTTGATVLSNLESTPPGILLWRSILQWMGGIGIVVMASGILPITQVGGMQLLQLEFDSVWKKYYPNRTVIHINRINLCGYYIYMCINVLYLG